MTSPASLEDDWPIVVPFEDRRLCPPGKPAGRLGRWFTVFAVNLPVCLLLGGNITAGSGRVAMGIGILILFGIGWELSRRRGPIGVDLVVGGSFIAIAQFIPFLQIWSGMLGIAAAEWATQSSFLETIPGPRMEFGPALIATLVTGGMLMMGALGLGFASRLVTPRHWRYGPETYEIKPKRLAPDDLRDFH